MDVEIKVHSWISENLIKYLNGIGIDTPCHIVDPDGTGWDIICAVLPAGWRVKTLARRIMSCEIPVRMFKIIEQ